MQNDHTLAKAYLHRTRHWRQPLHFLFSKGGFLPISIGQQDHSHELCKAIEAGRNDFDLQYRLPKTYNCSGSHGDPDRHSAWHPPTSAAKVEMCRNKHPLSNLQS